MCRRSAQTTLDLKDGGERSVLALRFVSIPARAQFSAFWAEEAGTVGTSGHKRGASAQANCRDSRARDAGPQI